MSTKVVVCKLTDKFIQNNMSKEHLKEVVINHYNNTLEKLNMTYYDYKAKKCCLYKKHSKL